MQERIKALVLAKQTYREYDELVWLYTSAYGVLSALVHGIKRKRSKFTGELELYSVVYVDMKVRSKGLSTIYGFELITSNIDEQALFLSYAYGANLSELTRRVLADHQPIEHMFEHLLTLFSIIRQAEQPELVLTYLQQKLVPYTGGHIGLDSCGICGKTSRIIGYAYRIQGLVCGHCRHALHSGDIHDTDKIKVLVAFFRLPSHQLATLTLNDADFAFLTRFWHDWYAQNLGVSLKSQKVLLSMKAPKEERQ
jgi:DNA repair protein RecO (recombination protein O)